MYLGIDIASVDENKPVNWFEAKKAGVKFAIFRGTYSTWADPTWQIEAVRARMAGLIVGAYLFPVMGKTSPSAKEQIAAFVKSVGSLLPTDLVPTLDVEFPGGIAKTGKSREELLAWVREAVVALRDAYKAYPMIYTSARVWDGEDTDSLDADGLGIPTPELLNCPLWLARYPYARKINAQDIPSIVDNLPTPPVPKAWGDATNVWIHQYQGDAIHLEGFSSTVDLNRFFDLRLNCRSGERVKWLQRKLGVTNVDGVFGPKTDATLRVWQASVGLVSDGIVGPSTFAMLCWKA